MRLITVAISEPRFEQLLDLQDKLDMDMKTLIDSAICVLQWYVLETKAGTRLTVSKESEQFHHMLRLRLKSP